MELLLNDLESIRREQMNGREYLVAPVTPMKAMNLDKGYVPTDEIRKSMAAWNGTTVTLNHPRSSKGDLVSANSPDIAEKVQMGTLYNVGMSADGETLEGEIWIDEHAANAIGGEAETVVDRLESGDPVGVSTSYFGDRLDAGEYDGEYRERVMGNIRPDHLAMLPNKTGRCSIDDGCVAGELAANSIQVLEPANADDPGNSGEAFNQRSQARTPEYSGTTTGEWSAPSLSDYGFDDVSSVDDMSQEQRSTVAGHSLLGETDADTFSNLSFFPVVEPSSDNLSQNALVAVLGGRGSQADISDDALESAQSVADGLLDDEFGGEDQSSNALLDAARSFVKNLGGFDTPRDGAGRFIVKDAEIGSLQQGDEIQVVKDSGESTNATFHETPDGHVFVSSGDGERRLMNPDSIAQVNVISRRSNNTMKTNEKIDFLVENTDLKRGSLEAMGDNCLSNVYENRLAGNDEDGGESSGSNEPSGDDADYVTQDQLEDFQDTIGEKVAEAISANEDRQRKQELVDTIMSNSDTYDREELEDIGSVSVLEGIADDQGSHSANYGALGGGVSASISSNDDEDLSGWENRAGELAVNEGDD